MVLRALHCGEVQGTRASAEGSPGQTTRVLRLCDSLQGSFVRLAGIRLPCTCYRAEQRTVSYWMVEAAF